MSAPLAGRVALVTGANHGIGAATAVELGRLGADVVVTYRRLAALGDPSLPAAYDEQRALDGEATLDALGRLGRRGLAIEADLADPGTPAALFDAAESELGVVSILVNNASGWRQDTFAAATTDRLGRPMAPVTAAGFAAVFDVDARAGALLMAELARRLRGHGTRWGRIVGLVSGDETGFPSEVTYGAAKAALINYTMSAATELAPDGITANVVHPPITDTGWISDEVRSYAGAQRARVAQPAEVAEVIGWLCTDAARLVTGTTLRLR